MNRDEAIKELQGWRSTAIFDGEKAQSMKEVNPELAEALEMAIEALKENEALRLLIDWAVDCDFGYDNMPEEYEKYKDYLEKNDLGYIDGLIYIAKQETKEAAEYDKELEQREKEAFLYEP